MAEPLDILKARLFSRKEKIKGLMIAIEAELANSRESLDKSIDEEIVLGGGRAMLLYIETAAEIAVLSRIVSEMSKSAS